MMQGPVIVPAKSASDACVKFKIVVAGEMAEWLKAHAWKACLGETLTWVRIPLSPPDLTVRNLGQTSPPTFSCCSDSACSNSRSRNLLCSCAHPLRRQARRCTVGIRHFHRRIGTRPGRWTRPLSGVGCLGDSVLGGQVCGSTLPRVVGNPNDSDTKRADG